jgi:ribosomal protein S6
MTYQLTVVFKSTLKEADRKKLVENIEKEFGKSKVAISELGQKPLAYPIKKEVSGYYVTFKAEGEDKVSNEFEKKLFTNENILRHLFLRIK